jgi:hypothetical protein
MKHSIGLAAILAAVPAGAQSLGTVKLKADDDFPAPLALALPIPAGLLPSGPARLTALTGGGPALPAQAHAGEDGGTILRFTLDRPVAAGSELAWGLATADEAKVEQFSIAPGDAGTIDLAFAGKPILAWQAAPLAAPKGGDKFNGSAFIHPLRTPGGFVLTEIQPSDHLHHFGIWWPWKFVGTGGKSFNTWELQEGQGKHAAAGTRTLETGPACARLEARNQTWVNPPGGLKPVIDETATLTAWRPAGDAWMLDIGLDQRAAAGEAPPQIPAYRYSGFSCRLTTAWTNANSRLLTSEGRGRDDANGQPARWVLLDGANGAGHASLLVMSAAGAPPVAAPERLRVWDGKTHDGMLFVNFNPVMQSPRPLDEANPAVSRRRYRLLAADRRLEPAECEAYWRSWTSPPALVFEPAS